ncbi:MAG: ABC transporter substrate-binding protein [Caldilineaceae bacterium]|nr:ABC transporter substrate-binding protein [Caldilineaceae bacterium]
MFRRIRQRVGVVVPFLLIFGMLAGCAAPAAQTPAEPAPAASSSSESTTTTSTTTATTGRSLPADAAEDQTLQYVTRGFSRLDPASEGGFGRFVISHLWMPFFIRDNEGTISPWLATGYDVSDDNTVYTVHINPAATWSDGSPVLAQEAKDYWAYGLDPERCVGCYLNAFAGFSVIEGAQAVADGTADEISGVVVKDDKTLEIKLTGPDPIFINRLALFDTGFVKMEDVEKGETFASDGSARVNGPFKVRVWDLDEKKFEIEQNPNWWGETKPYITEIIAQESADENVSSIMWQNDEVDIAFFLSNVRERIRAESPETFYQIPYATNLYFIDWVTIEPMDDINVRRALAHAVDWSTAINAAWEGSRNDRLMTGILTPELQCYQPGNWPDWGFDPAKAQEELAASSYGSAEALPKIRITTGGQSQNYIRTAEIMIEQWKENLGITDVELRPGSLDDAWGQEADLVNVRRQSQGAILPDPVNLLASHYASQSSATGSGIVDEELVSMLDDLKLMSREDPEFCGRVQEAEAKLLGHYILLPMIWDVYEYNVKPHVMNFGTNVDNNWANLLDMYIAKH